MWKIACAFGVIFCTFFFQVWGSEWCRTADEKSGVELLERAFYETGSDRVSLNVHGWVKVDDVTLFKENLEEMSDKIAASLNLIEGYEIHINEDKNIMQVEIMGMNGEGQAVTCLFSRAVKSTMDKRKEETYITLEINDSNLGIGSWALEQEVAHFLKGYAPSPRISSTFTGAFPGKLSDNRKKEIYNEIFNKVKGRIVEGIQQGELVSKTGYSPLLAKSLRTKNGRINLNVALRYNSYEDKTYLWVAAPIIRAAY